MKTLERLIQASKLELDRRRREIGDLQALRNRLEDQSAAIDVAIAGEKAASIADPLTAAGIGRYLGAARDQQATIAASMAEVDRKIEVLRDAIAEVFGEIKRYEQVLENRRRERRQARDRREQEALDEIALTRRPLQGR
ncbi:MAG: hypothetical protein VYB54_06095 [Pseudomonadota bacterium]|nr:hypothetical protein [Pseudomonadota bacterium]